MHAAPVCHVAEQHALASSPPSYQPAIQTAALVSTLQASNTTAAAAAAPRSSQFSTAADSLDSNLSIAVAAAAEHLAAHGWAVVPGVLSTEECQQYEAGVWDWLERLNDSIRCVSR
jgi:hypothetical protein